LKKCWRLPKKEEVSSRILEIGDTGSDISSLPELKTLTFHFLSASYFAKTISGDIFPAEIAMCKYALKFGVYDSFNLLVNPGKLPFGTAADAKFHSENTHKRESPPNIEGESDYSAILQQITSFMEADLSKKKSIQPIFVVDSLNGEDLKIAQMTIQKICDEAGAENLFQIFPMEHLLFKLSKKVSEDVPDSDVTAFSSLVMANDMLNRDKFMYADIGCEFHLKMDACAHCCLSKVHRWGFTVSELCLDKNTEKLIAGCHFPKPLSSPYDVIDEPPKDESEWDSISNSIKDIKIVDDVTVPSFGAYSSSYASQLSLRSDLNLTNRFSDAAGSRSTLNGSENTNNLESPATVPKPETTAMSISSLIMSKRGGLPSMKTRGVKVFTHEK
jgi:piRNA pathway germ-plasm component